VSKVYYAPSHTSRLSADDTLPPKFGRLLKKLRFGPVMKGKTVCIKMHTGHNVGYTTIRPLFVRILVDAVKEAGGRPFVTCGIDWSTDGYLRGYTQETLGAPIYPAAGVTDKYYYELRTDFGSMEVCRVCGNVADSDVLITLSHGKGHGHCGYGGVIKNLAMGCVTGKTRGDIHRLMDTSFDWDEGLCEHCNLCIENCPTGASRFNKDQKFAIFLHHCTYCMHCVHTCPNQAIKIDMAAYRKFQQGMALATKAVLGHFARSRIFHITVLMDITPLCDCWGFSTPSLVPDIGIMASKDLVALEQAALDAIRSEDYIEGSLPDQLKMARKGKHLFERIHHKDPYVQVRAAAELGLGSPEYVLVEVA
jgi:uncharacterized Fe-S center protein